METAISAAELRAMYASDAEERRGLARDVHDVVGNAMTAIHLQAKLALRTLEQRPAETAEALRMIAIASQRSLHELRSILGATRGADAPTVTLSQLNTLLATTVAGQLDVEITVSGDLGAVPDAHDEAAYRIVQESITNVLRHATATRVSVLVTVGSDVLSLEIADNGHGTDQGARMRDGGGHGIRGMRERAALLGGELSAAADGDSGFRVRAQLPLVRAESRGDRHGR
jgi:signal transduction histidine kinase